MALTSTKPLTYLSQPLKRSRTEFEQDQLDPREDSYNNLDQCCSLSHSPPTRLPPAQLSPPAQLTPPTQLPPAEPLPRAELTLENLLSHTHSIDPSAAVIMPAPSTASSKTTSPADSPQALAEYGLEMDSREAYPPDVEQYLAQHIQVPPSFSSPKAAKLNGLSKHLSKVSEATMVRLISDLITFSGKWEDEKDGEHYIRLDNNVFLHKRLVENRFRKLTQPQPDVCVGYILCKDAHPSTTGLFTREEELKLLRFNACATHDSLHPFMTGQIKTTKGDYDRAIDQTGRDGLALDAAMRELFGAAKVTPTAVDTIHWSETCNGREVALFIHWSVVQDDGSIRYHMKEFFQAHIVGNANNLQELRGYVRNIKDYAVTHRARRLKAVVGRILNPNSDSGYVGSVPGASPPQLAPVARSSPQQSFPVMPRPGYPAPRQGPVFTPTPSPSRNLPSFVSSPQSTPTNAYKRRRGNTDAAGGETPDQHLRPWDQ